VDAGTCFATSNGAGQTSCYSNGVREINMAVDGGVLVTITTPDGRTACYQVFVEGNGNEHYQTTAGQDFALVAPADGGFSVTCDGSTVVVDFKDPACATLNGSNCTPGACP
jgi:hypothetical protein